MREPRGPINRIKWPYCPAHTQKEEFASVGASEAARPPDESGNRRSITADELPAEETGGEHDGVMWVGRAGGGSWTPRFHVSNGAASCG